MRFEILKNEGYSRRGRLTLAHGAVETPVFMPVGTYGAVKTQLPSDLKAVGSQIILGNTYHLYLRPGLDILRKFEGLHRFMHWDRPILTDSGGFQVFSLGKLKKMSEEAVQFKNHLNGDTVVLSPELSAEIQQVIGSDIAMVLDECPALPNTRENIRAAVQRSGRWAKRFLSVPRLPGQAVFLINQGGVDPDLRRESLDLCLNLVESHQADGLAIGGLSVGETHEQMVGTLDFLAPHLPPKLPHYLMGVGTPLDILEGIRRGIDMFDCVLPTRNARNGGFFTSEGLLNIRNSCYTDDPRSIESDCGCECCQNYSRGYLRHLFQTKEIIGLRLATTHNLYYYHRFLKEIRDALEQGSFEAYYRERQPRLKAAYPGNSKEQEEEV